MDISSALKNEIFRPLTTIVVPGAVAIGPFILIIGTYVPSVQIFWNSHVYAFAIVVSIGILASGLILEDLGSRIEKVWDHFLEKTYPGRMENWENYLRLKTSDEIIGQRFLRTIFTRFKFELSMGPALIFFGIGLIWLNVLHRIFCTGSMAWIATFIFIIAIYIIKESYDSADQLGDLHKKVIESVKGDF